MCNGGRGRKIRNAVHQGFGPQINCQSMAVQEVRSKNCPGHVSHNKNPPELPTKSQAHGQAPSTVGGNAAAIDGTEGVLGSRRVAAIGGCGREDAHLSTSIDKKTMTGERVRDVQEAADRMGASGVGRSYWLAGPFPDGWKLQGCWQLRASAPKRLW